jgi:hypothetical protein
VTVCQPCHLVLTSETKILHKPHCPLDTRPLLDRLTQALADPGAILPRDDVFRESHAHWCARVVMQLLAAEDSERGVVDVELAPSGATTPAGEIQCRRRVATADGITMRCARAVTHMVEPGCRYVQESDNPPT